jgi:hypothetical protein
MVLTTSLVTIVKNAGRLKEVCVEWLNSVHQVLPKLSVSFSEVIKND